MKNQTLFSLCLAFLFMACEKETEFINRSDMLVTSSLSKRSADELAAKSGDSRLTQCIELTTTHWLTGIGKNEPIREMAIQETNVSNMPSRRYVIEASGDAMSESYARGFSELNLVYDTRTYKLTGVLTTRFYYDEVLELKFDGIVQIRNVGNMMTLRINVNEASFNTGKEVLILNYGEISFILPSTPEGPFELDINTKSVLCKP